MNAGRLERQLTFQRELTHWAPGEDGWLKMRGFAHQLAHGGRRDTASR
jgi:hypothetical protein